MNKVITINLNGNAYQLEENGYEALRAYLDNASRRLEGNPDRDEIIADIEQSIADKFRGALGVAKSVVVTKEVEDVIREMGPVQGEEGPAEGPAAAPGDGPAPQAAGPRMPRRLYRIREGARIGGVCNGLAAYLGIEVTIIRLIFVFVALTFGAGVLAYLIMMFVIPSAETPAEKAEAYGSPATAEEFIRRAREGYYTGLRSFGDKKAYREWKRQFRHDMRRHTREFGDQIRCGAEHWHHYWDSEWRHRWPGRPWLAPTFVSLLLAIVSLAGCFAILSLIFSGNVFGIFLPAGIPLWAGIVLLLVAISLIKWPLKEMRHGLSWHERGRHYWPSPFAQMINSFVWLSVVVAFLWWADHHSSSAHAAISELRNDAHRVVESLRAWWHSRS
ncbi:MAG TPA: PspC domain-containing protein [Opitutaceae bacterium]|jgi:phage shock protein PspC (stress-responsive transcriptional regulator)